MQLVRVVLYQRLREAEHMRRSDNSKVPDAKCRGAIVANHAKAKEAEDVTRRVTDSSFFSSSRTSYEP